MLLIQHCASSYEHFNSIVIAVLYPRGTDISIKLTVIDPVLIVREKIIKKCAKIRGQFDPYFGLFSRDGDLSLRLSGV